MKIIHIQDPHLTSVTPASRIDDYQESLFLKMRFLFEKASEINTPIFLSGDLFHTPSVIDEIKNRLNDLITKYKVVIFLLPGNHDLLYYNQDYLNRTSLGTMISSKMVKLLPEFPETFSFPNSKYKFSAIPQAMLPNCPVSDSNTILFAHAFLDQHFKDRLFLTKETIKKSKALFLCLGHDHNQYKVIDLGGTLVSRPGAISRGSSNTENSVRIISYSLIDLESKTIEYVPIPIAREFNEVFRKDFKLKENRIASFEDVKNFIDALASKNLEANVYDILLTLNLPEKVYNRAAGYLNAVGLNQ